MAISVRRIRPDEGPAFRAIRLAAIQDSPQAFGSSLAEIEARPEAYCEERARTGAAGNENVLFVAEKGNRWVGVVGGFISDATAMRSVDLVSMWVHPDYRGQGVGRRLVDQLVMWAREGGAERVVLWVTTGNDPAILLYRRCGFRETGNTQRLPSHPELREQEMVLDLTEAAGNVRDAP
jgi:ribosomal protein S18 acetylase RimI-like enzyme